MALRESLSRDATPDCPTGWIPLGTLAAYLLEPRSADGLVAWNFFDDYLEAGTEFPVMRIVGRMPITVRTAMDLLEDRETGRRLTYENIYEGCVASGTSGSPACTYKRHHASGEDSVRIPADSRAFLVWSRA